MKNPVTEVQHYALCQDCLKVHKGSINHIQSLAAEEIMCDNCAGQVCNCSSCINSALEIERIGVDRHVIENPHSFNPDFVKSVIERNGS